MVLVWGWTFFMGIFATHVKGRIVSWFIGILLNILLGIYYSYRVKHPKTWQEWLRM